MKIREIIQEVDELSKNTYKQLQKIKWISDLDTKIYKEIISTHDNASVSSFNGYTSMSLETETLAADEFHEMYVTYLQSKMDYNNGEWGRYNNSSVQFNELYSDFCASYNRSHLPKKIKNMGV